MSVACIIQARIKSTRLPAKTMFALPTGRTVIQEVIYRCSRINGIDHTIVAIPDDKSCDWFHEHIIPYSRTIRGPEDDVLHRYKIAADAVGAKHIMRITADCPCLDSVVAEQLLDLHLAENYDYTSNCWPRTYPVGYDCEVFRYSLLEEADKKATHQICREHVTPYFNGSYPAEQMSNVSRGNLAQNVDESDIRLTLDTVDDYIRICDFLRK